MGIFKLEHSSAASRADFTLHGMAVLGLAGWLISEGPRDQWPALLCVALTGLLGWTALEYALHRFLLHGLRPFRDWHAQHHLRPKALIYAPTVLIALCFVAGVALPAWLLFDGWVASALTLGLLTGYLAYSVTHHATHHWHGDGRWLQQRKRWHARHHHQASPTCYGVTTHFWDRVFRTRALPRKVVSTPSWPRGVVGATTPSRHPD